MFRLLALLLFVVSAGFVPQAVAAQNASQPARDAILVLDASGSMWARMDGRPQIVVAKDVILGLLDDLAANYRLGLMAYGHRRKGDCSDIEMMVPVGSSRDAIRAAVKDISPKGKTPMTQAVIDAAKALKYTENQATVILVSDGKESCGMDPCAAARKLEELGVDLTVHAIGFGMKKGSDGLKQVQCFAKNTGGQFFAANNAEQLTTALEQVSVAKPQPPAKVEVKLRATDLKDGPIIEQGLIWTVRDEAGGPVLYQSKVPEGVVTVKLPRGLHHVEVIRVSDEAGAEREIKTGSSGTTVTLPIVVELMASLKVPETAPAASTIAVEWMGPGYPGDYIGIFAAGDEDNRFGEISADSPPKGEPAELQPPSKPGDYEVRYIVKKGYKAIASEPIEVTPVKAALKVPASAPVASTITVEWTGPGYPGDYIGIFAAGDEDNRFGEISADSPPKGEPAELMVPTTPGDYEVRYIVKKGYKAIASEPIKITEPKGMQRGVDRPGSDYHYFDASNGGPKACLEACRQDDRCRAWAWTKAGFHSPDNRCWLKNEVPDPVPGPEGAVVSGVVNEQDRVSAHSAETSGRVPSQTSAVPASDLATLDPKYRLPPWEAWLQVQAKSLGAGWHTGRMSADLGVGCWTVVFNSDKPSTHGEDWLYCAEVERLRFRRMQYEAGIKNSAKLKQVARIPAEKWQEVPMSAVRAQDEAHSCELWAD